MTKILYIGRNSEILSTVVRLLNANKNWFGVGASTDEEAITLFSTVDFTLVLLGSGIEQESEDHLVSIFKAMKPQTPVIQHYGGGSGLLTSEILSAINLG